MLCIPFTALWQRPVSAGVCMYCIVRDREVTMGCSLVLTSKDFTGNNLVPNGNEW